MTKMPQNHPQTRVIAEVRFSEPKSGTSQESLSGEVIGYYALVLEEDFSVQDDFFVIDP